MYFKDMNYYLHFLSFQNTEITRETEIILSENRFSCINNIIVASADGPPAQGLSNYSTCIGIVLPKYSNCIMSI